MVLFIEPRYFQLLGFVSDYTALGLIVAFGIRLYLKIDKSFSESQREYQRGLALFLITIAVSMIIYGVDLTSRVYYGHRIFPAKAEFEEMGIYFDSLHPQSYFILILTFLLLSNHFLMRPIEKYMLNRKNPIISKMSLYLLPLPTILRILEITTLPQEGDVKYWIYSIGYYITWIVIGVGIVSILFLYIKVAIKSSKELRMRSIAVTVSFLIWLATVFQRPTILKDLIDRPYLFWLPPMFEILMVLGFSYGFSHNLGESSFTQESGKKNYLYYNWTFIATMTALFIGALAYFSIIAWYEDLDLVIYWKTYAQTHPEMEKFGDFIDRSFLEGDGFGGQDIAYLLVAPFILTYLVALFVPPLKKKLQENGWIRICGYVFASTFVLALVNRFMKAFFARARPGDAIQDPSIYSRIWTFGSYDLGHAFSTGSFTSGHTTTAMLAVAVAFLLIKTHKSWLVTLGLVLSYTYAVLMAFGRIVHGSHYLGDTVWAIGISTIVIVWLYFGTFKLHKQDEGELIITDPLFEFKWTFLFIFQIIFVLAFAVGVKYTILDFEWMWLGAMVISPIPIYFIWKAMKKLKQKAFKYVEVE